MVKIKIDMGPFIKKLKDRVNLFMLEFLQDMAYEVVIATPVKTGFLRASWYVRFNGAGDNPNPPHKDKNAKDRSQGDAETTAKITLMLARMKGGELVQVVNNASYAAAIEFGTTNKDKTARMEPRAMVRRTTDRAQQIANAAAARVIARTQT